MKFLKIFLLVIIVSNQLCADLHDDLLNKFIQSKKAVIFGNIVRDISTETSCAAELWNFVEQYACRCCLVRSVDQLNGQTNIDGKAIIERCKANGPCTDALIAQIKNDEKLTSVSDAQFLITLYDRSVIIKQVIVDDAELKKTGKFSENSLKKFLEQAYKTRKILDTNFSDANNLTVINLGTGGGWNTLQLFLVKNTKTGKEFIIKEIGGTAKREIFELSLASNYKLYDKYSEPNRVKDFPVLLLPLAYLEYEAPQNNYHYLSVMPKAQGTEFLKIMLEYHKNPTPSNENKLKQNYSALGKTLANFHKTFMQNKAGQPDKSSLLGLTFVHGDLHPKNIFIDESNTVYWIDNERLGKAVLRPVSPGVDLKYLLFSPFVWPFLLKNVPIDKKAWFTRFYMPFVHAYLDTFGGNKAVHAREMKELLHLKKVGDWSENDEELWQYMDPILDDIITPKMTVPLKK